ncbi:Uncharacterised protein [Segatella copri]|nr:Uncharacterised protein [Segatella copri]
MDAMLKEGLAKFHQATERRQPYPRSGAWYL